MSTDAPAIHENLHALIALSQRFQALQADPRFTSLMWAQGIWFVSFLIFRFVVRSRIRNVSFMIRWPVGILLWAIGVGVGMIVLPSYYFGPEARELTFDAISTLWKLTRKS